MAKYVFLCSSRLCSYSISPLTSYEEQEALLNKRISPFPRGRGALCVGNGKTLSREVVAAGFTGVQRVTRRQRQGRTSNPGVLSGGDVSSWSYFAMSWGTDLWVSALIPFLVPCGLLFTNKQLGFWHDFRKGVRVRLPVYSRSVLLVYTNTFTARNKARV